MDFKLFSFKISITLIIFRKSHNVSLYDDKEKVI